MKNTDQLELTIRVATVIKSLSHLVGATDAKLARMMFYETMPQLVELQKFIDSRAAASKNTSPVDISA